MNKNTSSLCNKKYISLLLILFFSSGLFAQDLKQNIRGVVLEKISQAPLEGAIVVLINSSPLQVVQTNARGEFMLKDVPVGRWDIKVNYAGYKESLIPNILLNSAKEQLLTIMMEEKVVMAKEIVITSDASKNKPINELLTVSARTFSVEETQKFAAAVNDPARMATSFAGVVQGDDGNNGISIRGNAPNGLLWRMEGVDIPNPNHFSGVGTSGGGISILSAQVLSNSDFMTGAFVPEYGNALSGVFDLKLRKGNNQKREYTLQAGVMGVDLATEGPFSKKQEGSYLINYRYSTLGILGMLGVPLGFGVPTFQDLSYNLSLPSRKAGVFGIFGFGGLSSQHTTSEKDSLKWKEDEFTQLNTNYKANTGATGLNHFLLLGRKTSLRSSLLFSATENSYREEKLDSSFMATLRYRENYIQQKLVLSSALSHKFSSRNSIKTGFIISRLQYQLQRKIFDDSLNNLQTRLNSGGHTWLMQAHANWHHHFSEKLGMNAGMHFLYLALNGSYSVEPRTSLKYELSPKNSLALGYGLHGQMQPIGIYFAIPENGSGQPANRDLKMSRAHHFVLSYDRSLSSHTHIKTEIYYQHLFDIPVSIDTSNRFSMLNLIDGFESDALANSGLGKNYGLELTLERFLYKNFYYLLSASLYDSRYRASNHQWYHTRFNTNYAASFTAGKEWQLSEKRKKKILGANIKLIYAGGFRYTPINLPASIISGEAEFEDAQSFAMQNPDYLRLDVRFSIKRNFKKAASTLSLDMQNATNHQNIGGQYFDKKTGSIKYYYQMGLIPVLSYKVEF